MRVELPRVGNPYDFANPVIEEGLFVGRTRELGEVKYYLDHAKASMRPIHLAFVGDRAAGKTSFLNITQIEASKRGMNALRIDLDEGDVESQLFLFRKIFNGIAQSVFEKGHFGGLTGKTYQVFLDIISSYKVPDSSTFLPFVLPVQIARALSSGVRDLIIDDTLIKRDLELIQKETDTPIVILFDECNVLKRERILLEKLRNVFMNMRGYMLVFAGTRDLFPVMDDVFSPIIRQFKKIEIGPFKTLDDVRTCLLQPLKMVPLTHR